MKIEIRGESWHVARAEPGRLEEDENGATFSDEKLIVLGDEACLATVRHELFHAYCSTLYVGSTLSLSLDDYEEMIAELMGDWLNDYVEQVVRVFLWHEESKRV